MWCKNAIRMSGPFSTKLANLDNWNKRYTGKKEIKWEIQAIGIRDKLAKKR